MYFRRGSALRNAVEIFRGLEVPRSQHACWYDDSACNHRVTPENGVLWINPLVLTTGATKMQRPSARVRQRRDEENPATRLRGGLFGPGPVAMK